MSTRSEHSNCVDHAPIWRRSSALAALLLLIACDAPAKPAEKTPVAAPTPVPAVAEPAPPPVPVVVEPTPPAAKPQKFPSYKDYSNSPLDKTECINLQTQAGSFIPELPEVVEIYLGWCDKPYIRKNAEANQVIRCGGASETLKDLERCGPVWKMTAQDYRKFH